MPDLAVPLGFGFADVVVAVPEAWIDVDTMADVVESEVVRTIYAGGQSVVAPARP